MTAQLPNFYVSPHTQEICPDRRCIRSRHVRSFHKRMNIARWSVTAFLLLMLFAVDHYYSKRLEELREDRAVAIAAAVAEFMAQQIKKDPGICRERVVFGEGWNLLACHRTLYRM